MLREIKNRFLHPRMMYGRCTTTGATATFGFGAGDATISRAGTGLSVITPFRPFSRLPVIMASPAGEDVAAGGFCSLASSSALEFRPRSNLAAGTGDEGTTDYVVFGYDSAELGRVIPQMIKCSRRRTRVIVGRLSIAAGIPSIIFGKNDFILTSGGTGVINIVYKKAFASAPVVFVNGVATSGTVAPLASAKVPAGCTVTIYDASGVAQDGTFNIVVMGSDSRDEHGGALAPVESSQRKPRIIPVRYTVSGAPTVVTGVGDVTGATNGTGDYTFTFTDAFKREPIVVGMIEGGGNRHQIHTTTSGTVRVLVQNGAGAAQGAATGHFIAFGFDDSVEY